MYLRAVTSAMFKHRTTCQVAGRRTFVLAGPGRLGRPWRRPRGQAVGRSGSRGSPGTACGTAGTYGMPLSC
eukprot:14593061-Alexandrium_andersonii.AAC.1